MPVGHPVLSYVYVKAGSLPYLHILEYQVRLVAV